MRRVVKKGLLTAAFAAAASAVLVTTTLGGPLAAVVFEGLIPWMYTGALSLRRHLVRKRSEAAYPPPPLPPGVPLTEGEIAFTKSIFGRKIAKGDLTRVRKYFMPEKKDQFAAVVRNIKSIDFHGRKYHEADYSRSKDPFNYGAFIHEMTHIWQNSRMSSMESQMNRHPYKYGDSQAYFYALSPQSRFKDFNVEQQASIIEDYALRFLYPAASVSSGQLFNTPVDDALLQKVVEDKFHEARKTRLRFEPQKKAQIKERLKSTYNTASGVIDSLKTLRDESGSTFGYEVKVSPTGTAIFIDTNIPRDNSDNKRLGLVVKIEDDGQMSIWEGKGTFLIKENAAQVVNYVTQEAAQKGLIKARAPRA
jgi:hypothetical protein